MFGAETQSGKSVGKQIIVDQHGIFAKRSTKPKGNKEVDSTAQDKTHSHHDDPILSLTGRQFFIVNGVSLHGVFVSDTAREENKNT